MKGHSGISEYCLLFVGVLRWGVSIKSSSTVCHASILSWKLHTMHLEFISLQAHNPIDGAKELKEDISNLKQEVMKVFCHSIL